MDKKIYAPFLQDEIQEIENYIHSKFDSSNYKMKDDFLQIFKAGGKRIRPAFVLLSGNLFKGDKGQLVKLASAIELIHMSTLIHDDIIDQADKRRGEATLNARYGKEWALYAGNYLFAEALEMVDPENNQEIAAVMAACIACAFSSSSTANSIVLSLSISAFISSNERSKIPPQDRI